MFTYSKRNGRVTREVKLTFIVVKFKFGSASRCMLVKAEGGSSVISACLYEAAYALSGSRYKGTIQTVLHHVAYLFTWAEQNFHSLEFNLLSGLGLGFRNIKRFSAWLDDVVKPNVEGEQLNRYPTKILQSCKMFVIWFVENYTPIAASELELNFRYEDLIRSHKKCWERVMAGARPDPVAPDISDELMQAIETNLVSMKEANTSVGARNYLMYRLVKSFGLRIGEALALRLCDINLNCENPYIEIVRIDERGRDYTDPRSPYQPKVKTLSRILYFDKSDPGLSALIDEYITLFRVRLVEVKGRTIYTNFVGHDFLFVEHGRETMAQPLSCSSATKIALSISRVVASPFHWHVLRHSTFNRLYEAAFQLPSNSTEIDHIVYIGGWSSPRSLRIYARKAIRDSALTKVMGINRRRASFGN